jgi:hypothetical protein
MSYGVNDMRDGVNLFLPLAETGPGDTLQGVGGNVVRRK